MGEKHDCVKFRYFNVLNIAALGRKNGPGRDLRETPAGLQAGLDLKGALQPELERCLLNPLFNGSLPRPSPEPSMVTSIHTY